MNKFSNIEDGVEGFRIADTGDSLIQRDGQYYYWLGSTSPRDNHGPYATLQLALDAYNGSDDRYTLDDLTIEPAARESTGR